MLIILGIATIVQLLEKYSRGEKYFMPGTVVQINTHPSDAMPGSLCFGEIHQNQSFGYYLVDRITCLYTQKDFPEYIRTTDLARYPMWAINIHESQIESVYFADDKVPVTEQLPLSNASRVVPGKFETHYFLVRGIGCFEHSFATHRCLSNERDYYNWYTAVGRNYKPISVPAAEDEVLLEMYNYKSIVPIRLMKRGEK
jgi:hypothetical protein